MEEKARRDQLLQVPMSADEMDHLDKMAGSLGWSKASVARWGILHADLDEMKEADPPGNLRSSPE